jgi:hypothetical protein
MCSKVYIEDFNPSSGCWNRTAIFDLKEFDKNVVYTSRYGGVVRIRYVDENGNEISLKETKKVPVKEKTLTEEISDDTMEVDEVEEEESVGFKKKLFG